MSEAQMPVDYVAFLSDLKAKRAALDHLIASIESAQTLGALGQPGDPGATTDHNPTPAGASAGAVFDLPSGAFLGQSVPRAVKLYLDATKKRQGNHQIAKALKEAGMST